MNQRHKAVMTMTGCCEKAADAEMVGWGMMEYGGGASRVSTSRTPES